MGTCVYERVPLVPLSYSRREIRFGRQHLDVAEEADIFESSAYSAVDIDL